MNQLSRFRLPALLALAVLLVFPACNKSGPAVIVDGKRLDESYLKENFPDRYRDIRNQYEEQLLEALKTTATQRLFEIEAKSLGIKPEELSKKIAAGVPAPTDEQIAEKYAELKKSGQIGNESLGELKDRIAMFLNNENRRAAFGVEFARLKKKYGYELKSNRELAKINIDGEPSEPASPGAVTVVEFTDFRCGFCKKARGTADELHKKYGKKIRWVIKDSPFQPGSMEMHKAANCVHKEQPAKYWQYFNDLFDHARDPEMITEAGLTRSVAALGVDRAKFTACFNDPATADEIRKDMEEGRAHGVNGTPAFFINGRMISGAQPLGEFVAIIDEELQK